MISKQTNVNTTRSSSDAISLAEIPNSQYVNTITWRLYNELLAEQDWSKDFKVYLCFDKIPHLLISHLYVLPDFEYNFFVNEGDAKSVEDVRVMTFNYFTSVYPDVGHQMRIAEITATSLRNLYFQMAEFAYAKK